MINGDTGKGAAVAPIVFIDPVRVEPVSRQWKEIDDGTHDCDQS